MRKTKKNITIRPIRKEDLNMIVNERNMVPETLRTPFMLNYDQQIEYYNRVLCDRKSTTRYWIFESSGIPVGFGGIENIEWENSRGEISLIIFQSSRGKGIGEEAVKIILNQGFNYLNLNVLWLECYLCGNWKFWNKVITRINKNMDFQKKALLLPDRKFFNGGYYDSFYMSLRRLK